MAERYFSKYEQARNFGLITSATSNAVWQSSQNLGRRVGISDNPGYAYAGAGEEVKCWDLKTGECLSSWKDSACSAEVSVITASKSTPGLFAVGCAHIAEGFKSLAADNSLRYSDGSIRLWDSNIATIVITFNGHRSAITNLVFDKHDVKLASGSKDTDIIIWDLIGETGLFKLWGHKDQITGLSFLYPSEDEELEEHEYPTPNSIGSSRTQTYREILVSTGKDSLIKLWDTESQHCFDTQVSQSNGECWSLGVSADSSGLVTGGNDGELKFWSVNFGAGHRADGTRTENDKNSILKERGILYRQGKDRTLGIKFNSQGTHIAAYGPEKAVEIWRIRTPAEIQKALARKRKRRKEKEPMNSQANDANQNNNEPKNTDDNSALADVSEVIIPYVVIRTGGRVSSFDWAGRTAGKSLSILAATNNNLLEIWSVKAQSNLKGNKSQNVVPDYARPFAIEIAGHRTDVRALALSSDDRMLASASNGSLKIWNVRTSSCIRTLDCGYALCASFLPGDRLVSLGNKNGVIELFDITSASLIETLEAHGGAIWSLQVLPDGKSMATGSADKTVKFFSFNIVQEEIPGTARTTSHFRLIHNRTLKVSDDVLSLRFSPDARMIALALLDNTVKVFFVDTLKLFLNLYGHKLPVLDMDISYDSKLIVTCSADKNVRLWGLDFGDCHKAFFAHQDSVIKVAFVSSNQEGNGHHFFSASKDRLVKYWDGDKFEQIQKLVGHHGEVWALTVSKSGDFAVSASHDKSIRVWEQTDEQIFLEEEREKEMDELYEKTLTSTLEPDEDIDADVAEAVPAMKQTTETLMAGEKIVEALDIGMEDLQLVREYESAKLSQPNVVPPPRNPIYLAHGGISSEKYLLQVFQRIKAAALQDALLVLPFDKIPPLFTFLCIWVERRWNMPLTCRILFFMLKTHHKQIITSRSMRVLLEKFRVELRSALQFQKDEMGFNLAALRFIGKRQENMGKGDYIDEERWDEEEKSRGKKKRAFVDVA